MDRIYLEIIIKSGILHFEGNITFVQFIHHLYISECDVMAAQSGRIVSNQSQHRRQIVDRGGEHVILHYLQIAM